MAGKYIRPLTATKENDPITGSDMIGALLTNIGWKQIHDWCKKGYDFDKQNADSPTKERELRVSAEIWDDIRTIYKTLNPSTSRNYGAAAPPDSEHLTRTSKR